MSLYRIFHGGRCDHTDVSDASVRIFSRISEQKRIQTDTRTAILVSPSFSHEGDKRKRGVDRTVPVDEWPEALRSEHNRHTALPTRQ